MNCIVIEDEIPAQKILQNFIGKIPNLQLIGTFNAAIAAHSFLNSNEVDLIFLDINLPDISGLEFIKTVKNPPSIIITTAYPDYAVSSFELDTIVDYLVKPIRFERFFKAINKIKSKQEESLEVDESKSIFLNVDKTHHKIILNDIIYVESDRNYISLITKNKSLSFIDTLKSWVDKLDNQQFIQVHKSFIVNVKRVDKISGNTLFIADKKIPIGRTYKLELLKTLNIV